MDIKQHRIRGKLFSSWRKLLEENARMVTFGKTQNVTGKYIGGEADSSSRRDPGTKCHNNDNSDDQNSKKDIINKCKASFKTKANDMATVTYLFPHHNNKPPPLCWMRDTCERKRHWLIGPDCCPQPKEQKAAI